MRKIKGRKIIYQRNGEVEYKLNNGLVVSVMDLHNDFYKMLTKITLFEIPEGKDFSVELIKKEGNTRLILELAQPMTFEELVKFCNEKERIGRVNDGKF